MPPRGVFPHGASHDTLLATTQTLIAQYRRFWPNTKRALMTILGLVLIGVAALIHVYIFVLESVLWTTPRARKTFGTTSDEANTTKALAFNQGFYNLFLAIVSVVGIVMFAAGATVAGIALLFTGAGSMVLAGLVLIISSPDKARAALVQLVPPALGLIALVIGL